MPAGPLASYGLAPNGCAPAAGPSRSSWLRTNRRISLLTANAPMPSNAFGTRPPPSSGSPLVLKRRAWNPAGIEMMPSSPFAGFSLPHPPSPDRACRSARLVCGEVGSLHEMRPIKEGANTSPPASADLLMKVRRSIEGIGGAFRLGDAAMLRPARQLAMKEPRPVRFRGATVG